MNALASVPELPAKRMRSFHLRLPVLLLWLLLLPFVPLQMLALLIVCAVYGINPFRAAAVFFQLFASPKGINVEVQTRQVSITFSLF
jgi:hypothetical protein